MAMRFIRAKTSQAPVMNEWNKGTVLFKTAGGAPIASNDIMRCLIIKKAWLPRGEKLPVWQGAGLRGNRV